MPLTGLIEYMKKQRHNSILKRALSTNIRWMCYTYEQGIFAAKVAKNKKYKVKLQRGSEEAWYIDKLTLKLIYPEKYKRAVLKHIKYNEEIKDQNNEPILHSGKRHYIKHKTLFVLYKQQTPVTVTLLGGEVMTAPIKNFTPYELTLTFGEKADVFIFRHAILSIVDENGISYLKADQEDRQDWKKSDLYFEDENS